MKRMIMIVALVSSSLAAAPVSKEDPVAENFPAWHGVMQKNYIMGREITASDLRHKVTVVIEVDAQANLHEQLLKVGEFLGLSPLVKARFGENWEDIVLPRDDIFVISVRRGGKDVLEVVEEALKMPKGVAVNDTRGLINMSYLRSPSVPIYSDVTLQTEVNVGGKYPFVYILAPTGAEPIFKGVLDDKGASAARGIVMKERAKKVSVESKWVPFFGSVTEDKYPQALVKTLEKGKTAKTASLAPVAKVIQKDIVSKDEERAVTAQIVYDAIEQTRSDLIMRIRMEFKECPHRAAYDVQQLLKFWPSEKKKVDDILAKIKEIPDVGKLAQIYCKMAAWADPDFKCKNAGEAKKIIGELNKAKKDLEKLKESKTITVQNGALLMDARVDELIALIPTRIPEK